MVSEGVVTLCNSLCRLAKDVEVAFHLDDTTESSEKMRYHSFGFARMLVTKISLFKIRKLSIARPAPAPFQCVRIGSESPD